MSKPPLLLHVIFHPASDDARGLARTIHKALHADPAVPGLRVPTVSCPTDGVKPPETYDLDEAERSFVAVLGDYLSHTGRAPLKLFLSHTKLDIDTEPKVIRPLIDYPDHAQPVRAWGDSGDIDAGSPFAEADEPGACCPSPCGRSAARRMRSAKNRKRSKEKVKRAIGPG